MHHIVKGISWGNFGWSDRNKAAHQKPLNPLNIEAQHFLIDSRRLLRPQKWSAQVVFHPQCHAHPGSGLQRKHWAVPPAVWGVRREREQADGDKEYRGITFRSQVRNLTVWGDLRGQDRAQPCGVSLHNALHPAKGRRIMTAKLLNANLIWRKINLYPIFNKTLWHYTVSSVKNTKLDKEYITIFYN